ncbi:hypothetical protein AB836_00435 [Rickettsiales bacterium (ex Bugula neritina AB1)]|nr:hypothetical protein AB836_00435 [Rickettsiales bacterium (ex Bugula neritina AB1)]
MNFIGVDISKNYIGFSVNICNTNICSPLCIIKNKKIIFMEKLKEIKEYYKDVFFVIGIPDKKIHEYNHIFIKNFTHRFRSLLQPFDFTNENYTTFLSKSFNIDKKKRTDDIASSLFLKDYLLEKKIINIS